MHIFSAGNPGLQDAEDQERLFRVLFWIVFAGALVIFGGGIWNIPILSHNEARRLVALQEMLASHNWLLPTKNGLLYLEKPPLFYWSGGLVSLLTGSHAEWVLRLPSALSALAVVWLLFSRMRRHVGSWAALNGAMILVSSYFFAETARIAELNMMLALWVFAAVLLYYSYLTEKSDRWLYLSYAALGLAFLTKGPVALLFFVPTVAVFALLQKDWSILRGLATWRGWLIFALVALPWFVYVSLSLDGMPLLNVLMGQVADKVSTAQPDPWYDYPLFLLGAFAPWTLLLFYRPRRLFKKLSATVEGRYFAVAVLVPLVLFSLIDFKRPKYILPLCPSFAVLLGIGLDHFRHHLQQRWRRAAPLLVVGIAGLMILLNAGYYLLVQPRVLTHRYAALPEITSYLKQLPDNIPLYYFKKEPIQLIYYLGHPVAELDEDGMRDMARGHEVYYLLAEDKYWDQLRESSLCLRNQFSPYLHRKGRIGLWQGGGDCSEVVLTDQ